MEQSNPHKEDKRLEQISELLVRFAASEFNGRLAVSGEGDALDAIILGLNTLGEELLAAQQQDFSTASLHDRLSGVMNVLLKYTVMDFSDKAVVSEIGDEVDAIALGLNTLGEELDSALRAQENQINALKQSEERFRLLVENVKDYSIFMIDPEGFIVSWNKGAELIKGYKAEEIIGKNISVFYTDEELAENEAEENLRLAREKGRFEKEGWRVRKNGTRFWADVVLTALYNEDNKLRGFAKVTRDITERKITEEKILALNRSLEQKIKEAELVNKELEAFSYSVSHDLRAPLRAIHGYTKILSTDLKTLDSREAMELMEGVMQNAKRMGQLIDDLLAFSRIGKKELVWKQIDMNTLVSDSIGLIKNQYPESKARFVVQNLPSAFGDFSLLVQVFVNLISNAVKYSQPNPNPKIEIGSTTKEGEIIYWIRDNGVGFDMKYYNKLFGVFQRLHHSAEFEGTGVGLALVHRIITRHGGRVWGEGELGKGATFYLVLPAEHLRPETTTIEQ